VLAKTIFAIPVFTMENPFFPLAGKNLPTLWLTQVVLEKWPLNECSIVVVLLCYITLAVKGMEVSLLYVSNKYLELLLLQSFYGPLT